LTIATSLPPVSPTRGRAAPVRTEPPRTVRSRTGVRSLVKDAGGRRPCPLGHPAGSRRCPWGSRAWAPRRVGFLAGAMGRTSAEKDVARPVTGGSQAVVVSGRRIVDELEDRPSLLVANVHPCSGQARPIWTRECWALRYSSGSSHRRPRDRPPERPPRRSRRIVRRRVGVSSDPSAPNRNPGRGGHAGTSLTGDSGPGLRIE
jgi:hypothetical protein